MADLINGRARARAKKVDVLRARTATELFRFLPESLALGFVVPAEP